MAAGGYAFGQCHLLTQVLRHISIELQGQGCHHIAVSWLMSMKVLGFRVFGRNTPGARFLVIMPGPVLCGFTREWLGAVGVKVRELGWVLTTEHALAIMEAVEEAGRWPGGSSLNAAWPFRPGRCSRTPWMPSPTRENLRMGHILLSWGVPRLLGLWERQDLRTQEPTPEDPTQTRDANLCPHFHSPTTEEMPKFMPRPGTPSAPSRCVAAFDTVLPSASTTYTP